MPEVEAVAVLPSVWKPGRQAGPDGNVEVSTADFAEHVLQHVPDSALLFRLGDVLGALEGEPGARRFRRLDVDPARLLIDRCVRITSTYQEAKTKALVETYHACTRDLAGLFVAYATSAPGIRTLRSLVSYPVYLPGFDLARPGWNEKGGVFYDAPPHLEEVLPDPDPSLDVLDDLVIDFPFKDEASRQNVYALMLTRLLRPAIEGPTPFFFVMASLERTGKGKLLDTASLAVTGERMHPMQIGGDEDEREKRITSLILKGAQAVHFDNVPTGQDLDSASIASLATAWPSWSGRILGASALPSLPNSLVVAFSGNNPKASGENAKRSVPIVLESATDHPEARDDFKHPDCYAFALASRPKILATLLGFVEAWKRAGRPSQTRRLGGFERWAESTLAILHAAGARQVLGNYMTWLSAANDFGADAESFLAELTRLHQAASFTATEAFTTAENLNLFGAYYGGKNDRGRQISFGMKVLAALIDRPTPSGRLRKVGGGSTALYNVCHTGLRL